jgi:hypothetical protein
VAAIVGEWPIYLPDESETALYGRNWRSKVSDLTRSLGRPIRDQVFTRRNSEATTLQALQLQSGQELAYVLNRGAHRLLDRLQPPPRSLFDSQRLGIDRKPLEVDVSGVHKLWLLVEDEGSYDPGRTIPSWADVVLTGPDGEVRLDSLVAPGQATLRPVRLVQRHRETEQDGSGNTRTVTRKEEVDHESGVVPPFPGVVEVSIPEPGFQTMQGYVGVDSSSDNSAINPRVRFLVFAEEPDRRQLTPAEGPPPVPFRGPQDSPRELVRYLYQYALSRPPSAGETEVALGLLSSGGQEVGLPQLEDLSWALMMSPEFQYIH